MEVALLSEKSSCLECHNMAATFDGRHTKGRYLIPASFDFEADLQSTSHCCTCASTCKESGGELIASPESCVRVLLDSDSMRCSDVAS